MKRDPDSVRLHSESMGKRTPRPQLTRYQAMNGFLHYTSADIAMQGRIVGHRAAYFS